VNDRITINDVRQAGYCVSGARRWFEQYGFDFKAFIRDGCTEEEFLARCEGDACALRVVAVKRENG